MTSAKNVANAVGGKTARACDGCITKRARWYCAADDAFLCQACDSSVHSANPLARRHERVRLKTASFKSSDAAAELSSCSAPSWHHGFTKKARTPRRGKNHSTTSTRQTPKSSSNDAAERNNHPFHLVPEEGSDEVNSHEENEEQLLYRVPIFDPFVAELCSPPSSVTSAEEQGAVAASADQVENKGKKGNNHGVETLHGFPPSDIELAQFAADVESLLGRGLETECMVGMEELGLTDNKEEEECWECSVRIGKKVKVEQRDDDERTEVAAAACKLEADHQMEMVIGREPFELSFDYDSRETCDDDEVKEKVIDLHMAKDVEKDGELGVKNNYLGKRRRKLLQLDYEAVISAWASDKSPWTYGDKPNIDPDECWPHCMGTCGTHIRHPYGEMFGYGCHPVMGDGSREARVSRYREKRRTRLFSKKIRYEVRKLNAEKRPRMKGRFVKRASFAAQTFPLLNK